MRNNIQHSITFFTIAVFLSTAFSSCKSGIKRGEDMAGSDIEYLKKIGLMEKNEHVILFENHDGKPFAAHPQSGNFFTDKRIAAYWIDKDPKLTSKNFAYYRDIDSITVKDRSTALTYASYLTVYKHDGRKFKVFVDGNRRKVDYFFKSALEEWSKNKPKISKSL